MSQNESARAEKDPYRGGNEVFFSFLQSLLRAVDEGTVSEEAVASVFEDWGKRVGEAAGLKAPPELALEQMKEVLGVLGLVRVFEPARSKGSEHPVLVLRCLMGRYVAAPRVAEGRPRRCMLPHFVRGALAAAGVETSVAEDRAGMLRADECILQIAVRETP